MKKTNNTGVDYIEKKNYQKLLQKMSSDKETVRLRAEEMAELFDRDSSEYRYI